MITTKKRINKTRKKMITTRKKTITIEGDEQD
jgi:hypothetical protein